MSTLRKAIVIYEEDSAITILKPFSEEHLNYLCVINEDAYGEFLGELITKTELKKRLNYSDEEFNKILKQLEI